MTIKNLSMYAALFAAVSGCGGLTSSSSSNTSGSSGDLTVVQADEASGKLVATFRQDGRMITFEMRLGGPMGTPPAQSEVDVPRMEIDARVLDQNGQPIYVQMAGDEFMDATWDMPVIENINEADRKNDFALIQAAESAFREVELPVSFEQLRLGALQMARMVPELNAKPDLPNPADSSAGSASDRRVQANIVWSNLTSVKYWDYRIYRKDAFISGSPFDHSAVQLRGWSSSYVIVFTAVSCNHGACAAVSPMTVKCTMPGYLTDDGSHSRYFYNEPSTTSAVTSGCSTTFNPYFDNGSHVCNDDTILQINAIKYDRSYSRATGATGECNDNYANYWAPNCI